MALVGREVVDLVVVGEQAEAARPIDGGGGVVDAALRARRRRARRRSSRRRSASRPLSVSRGTVPAGHRERERAGAEGDLGIALAPAAMAEQGGLLVDQARGDRACRARRAERRRRSGGSPAGTRSARRTGRHRRWSHCSVSRFIRLVREAVVTSVAKGRSGGRGKRRRWCRGAGVRAWRSAAASGTLSSSQRSLAAEK